MKKLDEVKIDQLREWFINGRVIKETACELNLSTSTVSKYFAIFRAQEGKE